MELFFLPLSEEEDYLRPQFFGRESEEHLHVRDYSWQFIHPEKP